MTQDRDPFELLPHFVDPEPDPVIMNATIAQSREAFAGRRARTSASAPFRAWLGQSTRWLVPAGVGAVALVAAIAVAPNLMGTSPSLPSAPEMVADTPVAPSTELGRAPAEAPMVDAPVPDQGTRMGMQPGPGSSQAPAEPLPQVVSIFEGENISIGTRLDETAMEIYLPDLSGETTIDTQGRMPGEQIELLGAFALAERDLVAVQFMVDATRFWRIYSPTDGVYGRNPELSKLVSDAPDAATVKAQLEST